MRLKILMRLHEILQFYWITQLAKKDTDSSQWAKNEKNSIISNVCSMSGC